MLKIIINPRSRRKITFASLAGKLRGTGCSVSVTTRAGEALDIAREASAGGASRIIAVGGDGTVNEVINGMAGSDVPLGIIPAGGANDLAGYLRIPMNIEKALDIALGGAPRRIDLIKINGRFFATIGGLGFATEVALNTNKWKASSISGKLVYALIGSNIYRVYALYQALFKPEIGGMVDIMADGVAKRAVLWSFFAGNQPVVGKNFHLAPGALNDDGLMDICLIREMKGKWKQVYTLLLMMKGRHIDLPHVEILKARSAIIDCRKSFSFFGDGELLDAAPPYRIEIVPGALETVAPA